MISPKVKLKVKIESRFLLLLVYHTVVAKTYVTHWSGPNIADNTHRLRELSGITEIGANVSFHYSGSHVYTFSFPTNKDVYGITSPALLLIVYMIQCNKCNVQCKDLIQSHDTNVVVVQLYAQQVRFCQLAGFGFWAGQSMRLCKN